MNNNVYRPHYCNHEDFPCCGCGEPINREPEPEEMEHRGWPGDGSGEDDLADYNQNEADDYAHEGAEDSYLDSSYEDRCEMDYGGDY